MHLCLTNKMSISNNIEKMEKMITQNQDNPKGNYLQILRSTMSPLEVNLICLIRASVVS